VDLCWLKQNGRTFERNDVRPVTLYRWLSAFCGFSTLSA